MKKNATQEKDAREDGRATRRRLLACAGRVFAEKGYDRATSKEICQKAGTNLAAVNYHFGGRDGLYAEVLRTAHLHIVSLRAIRALAASEGTPREKLETFFRMLFAQGTKKGSWQVRVLVREFFAPSPLLPTLVHDIALPKGLALAGIFAAYTHLPLDDAELYAAMLAFLAPLSLRLLAPQAIDYAALAPVPCSQDMLLEGLLKFAFAGLDSFIVDNGGSKQ